MDPVTNAVNTENFFKFSFLLGAFLIVFGFVYPIEKSQHLDLEIIDHNQNVKITNFSWEISAQEAKALQIQIQEIDRKHEVLNDSQIQRKEFLKATIKEIDEKAEIELIKIEASLQKIQALEKHIAQFEIYKTILLIIGILSIMYGGWHWHGMSKIDKDNKKLNSK
jgi:hypothetical protein